MGIYGDYSDEKLIQLYRKGEESVIDFLFEKYKNLVRKKAKAMYLVGGDNDDLIQEGMIGLYKAVRDYDETRDTSFATFASMCINRQLCTAVSASNRKKHAPLNGYVSFESSASNEEDSEARLIDILQTDEEQNPEKLFIDRERADMLEDKLNKALSGFEHQVLALYIGGHDYIQISELLKKPTKSIDNALQRIRNKLSGIV